MQLSRETLRTITLEIEPFGVTPENAEAIVRTILQWYWGVIRIRAIAGRKSKWGRPRKLAPVDEVEVRRRRKGGEMLQAIADRFGVSASTISYTLCSPAERKRRMVKIRECVDRHRATRLL